MTALPHPECSCLTDVLTSHTHDGFHTCPFLVHSSYISFYLFHIICYFLHDTAGTFIISSLIYCFFIFTFFSSYSCDCADCGNIITIVCIVQEPSNSGWGNRNTSLKQRSRLRNSTQPVKHWLHKCGVWIMRIYIKIIGIVPCAYNLSDSMMGGEDKIMFHIHWPVILAYLAKFQLNEPSCLKQKCGRHLKWHSRLSSNFFIYVPFTHHSTHNHDHNTPMHICTYTQISKIPHSNLDLNCLPEMCTCRASDILI